jgi:hypothetical protein
MTKNLLKNILVSITGKEESDWQKKLEEIKSLKIKEFALFLEMFEKSQREKIYSALLELKIKYIPLVHLRDDMEKAEIKFLKNNFKVKYFTLHEDAFTQGYVKNWKGFYKDLYLEMNFDNFVSKKVKVEKIGGFCVDLAHFKVGMEKLSKDFEYVFDKKSETKYFDCNHLNGWNPATNCDAHTIHNLSDFDYIKTLPKFLFGKVIALETFNSVAEQLEFKKYLSKIL